MFVYRFFVTSFPFDLCLFVVCFVCCLSVCRFDLRFVFFFLTNKFKKINKKWSPKKASAVFVCCPFDFNIPKRLIRSPKNQTSLPISKSPKIHCQSFANIQNQFLESSISKKEWLKSLLPTQKSVNKNLFEKLCFANHHSLPFPSPLASLGALASRRSLRSARRTAAGLWGRRCRFRFWRSAGLWGRRLLGGLDPGGGHLLTFSKGFWMRSWWSWVYWWFFWLGFLGPFFCLGFFVWCFHLLTFSKRFWMICAIVFYGFWFLLGHLRHLPTFSKPLGSFLVLVSMVIGVFCCLNKFFGVTFLS